MAAGDDDVFALQRHFILDLSLVGLRFEFDELAVLDELDSILTPTLYVRLPDLIRTTIGLGPP